ncbi:MAG TPA: hypothetical protein VJS92_03775 [Candidatus Polarisedimenticolaceae bacterium]|nr:hypothetical protein [Candidatus Polarisedimenticolaceae bacterium]
MSYGVESSTALVDTVHAIVRHDRGTYAAECLELAVVTQGASLDELIVNLREAITLHLQGEDSRNLGVVPHPRLSVQYELAPIGNGP